MKKIMKYETNEMKQHIFVLFLNEKNESESKSEQNENKGKKKFWKSRRRRIFIHSSKSWIGIHFTKQQKPIQMIQNNFI